MKTLWMLLWMLGLPVVAAELKVGDEIRVTLRGVPAEDSTTVTGDYTVNERGEVRLHLLEGGVSAAETATPPRSSVMPFEPGSGPGYFLVPW